MVSPSLELALDSRSAEFGSESLNVIGIALNVRAFNPTLRELLLYNWQEFIDAVSQFEFLETVKMSFTTELQCARMIQEHERFINKAALTRKQNGRPKCTFYYMVEDKEGILWQH